MENQGITGYHLNFNIGTDNHTHPLHNDNACLIYITKGNGFLKSEEELFTLSAGQCFFQEAHHPLCYWSDGGDWEYIWILFDGPMFQEMLPKTGFSRRSPVVTCSEDQQRLIEDIISHRFDYHGKQYYQTLALVVQLIASFIETFPSDAQMIQDTSTKFIINFITNNLHRSDLNVKLLMQVTGLGRTVLYDKFRRKGLPSPAAYIQSMRLTKAKHLLRATDLPIGQIAFMVGFEDPLYFSRLFRRAVKHSPTSYRNYFNNNKK